MLRPDGFARRLASISLDELAGGGIRGLIVDLDNTLVGYGRDVLEARDAAWIASALERGMRVVVVSNNFTARVARIALELGVPAVSSALKPLPRGFRIALRLLGTTPDATIVVGDQLFTDVLGAKLTGMRSILTEPLVAHDWHGTKVLRFFERIAIGRARATGRDAE